MYSFLTRNGQTIAFGIGVVVTVIMIILIGSGVGEWSLLTEDDMKRYDTTIFNFGMYAAMGLIVACFIAALGFGIYHVATNPKGALKGVAGLVAVVALFFIIRGASDPDPAMLERLSEFAVTPSQSQGISGVMWTGLLLAGAAVVATAVSEVINIFR